MAEISSGASASVSVSASSNDWWLKDPKDSSVNRVVNVAEWTPKRSEKSNVFTPLGRTRPVVVSDGFLGTDGALTLEAIDKAEWDGVKALVERSATLLLQSPWGDNHYVRLLGDRQYSIVNVGSNFPARRARVAYVEVDVP